MKVIRFTTKKSLRKLFFMLAAFLMLAIYPYYSMYVTSSFFLDDVHQGYSLLPVTTPSTDRKSNRFTVHPSVQKIYDEIDNDAPQTRCARYGFQYKPRDTPRRIFFGSLIADESLDTLRIHATEVYGIYETVSFVESNLTQTMTKRPLRYTKGAPRRQFIESGVFGSSTRVNVDFFFNDTLDVSPLLRERIQRGLIIERWKKNGMKPDDIGIIADVDESWSRDFLRAAQLCDIPVFRPNQDCGIPKLAGETLIFESSPECMQRDRRWIHPDMILGECIDGIGDPKGHPVPRRQAGKQGLRNELHVQKVPHDSTKKYPLWNAADFREEDVPQYAEWKGPRETGGPAAYVSAFHFHNFFDDLRTLRNKYLTYGHAEPGAMKDPLSSVHDDIDIVVRCVHGVPNPNSTWEIKRFRGGFEDILGPKPIFFQNETYRFFRHAAVRRMILQDEKEHGSIYPLEEESEETIIRHY
jgi:hypothetical protein